MRIVGRDHRGKPIHFLEVKDVAYEIHPKGRRWALQRIRPSGDLTEPITVLDTAEECREAAEFCEEALEEIEKL